MRTITKKMIKKESTSDEEKSTDPTATSNKTCLMSGGSKLSTE